MGLFSGSNLKRAGIGFATFGGSEFLRAANSGGGESVDIGAELARLRGLFSGAESGAVAGVRRDAGQARGRAADNLAARGILRSGVSENVFQRVRDAELAEVGQVRSRFGIARAQAQSGLLQQLLGLRFRQEQQRGQRKAALFGTAGSIAGNVILGSLLGPAAPIATSAVTNNLFRGPAPNDFSSGGPAGLPPTPSTVNSNISPILGNFGQDRRDATNRTNPILERILGG